MSGAHAFRGIPSSKGTFCKLKRGTLQTNLWENGEPVPPWFLCPGFLLLCFLSSDFNSLLISFPFNQDVAFALT